MNCNNYASNPYSIIWDSKNKNYKADSENIFSSLDPAVFPEEKVFTLASSFSILPIKGQGQFPLNMPFFKMSCDVDIFKWPGLAHRSQKRKDQPQNIEHVNKKIRTVANGALPLVIRLKEWHFIYQ
ncbi:MAG: hypothetical protein H0V82_08990 [Candidatus Protochlamydia sp.]|nr:hypothetical protein [Candidatus Protochlamydia sp.]